MKIGISSCLLGNVVRYDGTHKLDRYLRDVLGNYVEYIAVCPEVECGLAVPREAMHLVGDPGAPRLITIRTRNDLTNRMRSWAQRRVAELAGEDLCGFIFKSKSPSCGLHRVKVYTDEGMPARSGRGIFADEFVRRYPGIPVEEEGRLHDPLLRENFIERVFVLDRWKRYVRDDGSVKGLVGFHTDHKMLIMAHSHVHMRRLGALVAAARKTGPEETHRLYLDTLFDGLKQIATVSKHVDVLVHLMGHLRGMLTGDEKQELLEIIEHYHRQLVPLIAPIVLLQHYARKYDVAYLKRQHYLHPFPDELKLRDYVLES